MLRVIVNKKITNKNRKIKVIINYIKKKEKATDRGEGLGLTVIVKKHNN